MVLVVLKSLSVAPFSTFMQWHLDGIVPVPDGQTELYKVTKYGSLGEVIELCGMGHLVSLSCLLTSKCFLKQSRDMRGD